MTVHTHFAPPSHLKKKSVPPFCHENYGWEKHANSIFTGKFVAIFFQGPLTRVKNFKPKPPSPFCIRPPPNKCLWTVPKSTRQNEQPKYFPSQNHSAVGFSIILFRSRRTYIFVFYACLLTFYCDQLFPVLSLTFACLCEIFIRRIFSSWRMFLFRIIHCLHFRQPGRYFCSYAFFAFPRNRT